MIPKEGFPMVIHYYYGNKSTQRRYCRRVLFSTRLENRDECRVSSDRFSDYPDRNWVGAHNIDSRIWIGSDGIRNAHSEKRGYYKHSEELPWGNPTDQS